MVTLANTQNYNEFELHLRAILGIPIPEVKPVRVGASAVILASEHSDSPLIEGLEKASLATDSDLRVFGKPSSRPYRRMGVALAYDELGGDVDQCVARAKAIAAKVTVK